MGVAVVSWDIIVLLAVATGGLVAGRALAVPSIVAYLLAGVLVGPSVLGWVGHSATIEQMAELGVTLLLFGVGIDFSLDRLRRILRRMVAGGALQVGITVVVTAFMFHGLGAPLPTAILAGFLVSLSSTAIVFKLYSDDGQIDTPQGQAAAGILLFQDLALVPMMLLVPALAAPAEEVLSAGALALGKAALALGGLLFLARAALPRALELIARSGTPELFPLAALVIAFGTALGAAELGLSLPIGAFLAGLALSGSPYAHQVFAELLPLRDAFVAVFFTSIGMLLEPAAVAKEPAFLVGMLGMVIMKGALAGAIVGILWRSERLAILSALGLAQIGELSLVLARQGVEAGLLAPPLEQAFLAATIITMGATPFLVALARRLAHAGSGRASAKVPEELRDHVLVVGYGTTGQAIARVLRETGIPFAAVDMAAEIVTQARNEGMPVRFGDASRRAVLQDLGAARARAAVVTVGDPTATRRIVSLIRQMNADIRILARVERVAEIDELERLGADEVIPSEFETSIELFVRLLVHLGVPRHVVRIQEGIIRLGHYQALRGLGSSEEVMAKTQQLIAGGILESARVMEGSPACGRTLGELDVRSRTGATVLSVVRGEMPEPTPGGATRLEAGDLVVLFGAHEAIDRALRLLEPGAADAARAR